MRVRSPPRAFLADLSSLSYVDLRYGNGSKTMAKNGLQQQQQKKTDNGAAAQSAPESIDQVRDLLFGGQMRMVEARIQNLDERLSHETNSMRAEFERQVTELDNAIKKELTRQTERL